jgi:hypothetical protein
MALLLGVCALGLSALEVRAQRSTELSGTVTGYSTTTTQLNVNTRLGPRSFLVNSRTIIVLNNHSATTTDIQVGDRVTVEFRFDTLEASFVRLVRELKARGPITATSTTTIDQRINGGVFTLRTNANSVIVLEGIPVSNRAILIGRGATSIYEPSTLTLLSLSADALVAVGTISAIDTATRKVTVRDRVARDFVVDANATIRRNGSTVLFSSLALNDRVKLAWVRSGAVSNALALDARTP